MYNFESRTSPETRGENFSDLICFSFEKIDSLPEHSDHCTCVSNEIEREDFDGSSRGGRIAAACQSETRATAANASERASVSHVGHR